MKKWKSNWKRALPYLIGGLLFFIGSARLLVREDTIGAVIFAVTGVMAVIMAYVSVTRHSENPG